jgi:adenosylmethionine-8-amino-7-oxononanoate aminotransferase
VHPLAKLDHQYVWHPFTQMRDWLKSEPILITKGKGAVLEDIHGRKYLDANSSIWTNLHGHNHPKLNAAVTAQVRKIAHSSALGLANEPASFLARELVHAANWPNLPQFGKVFYSDDGSTAMEVALKLAYEFTRRSGRSKTPRFVSLRGAYHGDTIGAVSVGHIDLFHKSYRGLLFKTDSVPSPYCYRCPHNRAKPDRADAREYRKCNWECVDEVEKRFAARRRKDNPYAAMVVEPLIQGAAGMIPQPEGWLKRVNQIVRQDGALLIADEVLTGFGRTGVPFPPNPALRRSPAFMRLSQTRPPLFACHHESVQPDLMALAKGMTGGYLPMAATLVRQKIFDAFLGNYSEFKTFFHGHSYTANQLGSAASLANLELLQSAASIRSRITLQHALGENLDRLWQLPHVGDIRQVGLIAGVELVKDWRRRERFPWGDRVGARVCEAMARRGVLTRPIGDIVVIMPPFCATPDQIERIVSALHAAVQETLVPVTSKEKARRLETDWKA